MSIQPHSDAEAFHNLLNHWNQFFVVAPSYPKKNRVFDPATDGKYKTSIDTPYELMYHSRKLQMTFLAYGPEYAAPKAELKKARNTMRKAGLPALDLNTPSYPLLDTMVVELASNIHEGFVCTVRFFGSDSKYNRWEDATNYLQGFIKCLEAGCGQIQALIKTNFKWVKRVIFQIDSEEIMAAVTNIWDWYEQGFPADLSTHTHALDYLRLNARIQSLEDTSDGIHVLFWKLPKEYLPGAWHQTEVELRKVHPRKMTMPEGSCGPCTAAQQMQELKFAKFGVPGPAYRQLVEKHGHLKVGDTFPLFNNAGLDVKVTMKVDGSVAVEAEKAPETKALQPKDAKVKGASVVKKACEHFRSGNV